MKDAKDYVKEMILDRVQQIEYEEIMDGEKIKLSVTLNKRDHEVLQTVAERLLTKKTVLASEFISQSIKTACELLKIDPYTGIDYSALPEKEGKDFMAKPPWEREQLVKQWYMESFNDWDDVKPEKGEQVDG